jgi:tryptophanyl-tRNA synthetase
VCTVWDYHKIFSDKETQDKIYAECRAGSIGCMQCKKECAANIDKFITPIREKKESLSDEFVIDVIKKGEVKAKEIASKKMNEVNKVIF